MDYQEMLANARANLGPLCKACPVCDGRGCKGAIPGPGAKGRGTVAIENYEAWQRVRVNMDTLHEAGAVDTSTTLFGRTFVMPVFAGPVGAVKLHYGDTYDDAAYNDILVPACANAGIAAFVGDGTDPTVLRAGAAAVKAADGVGVPTIKPWDAETVRRKLVEASASHSFAVAMDVDAAGLPFLVNAQPPAGPKSVDELRKIISLAGKPFIVKGIMTVAGAQKAVEAGAAAIIVSNHGGRVLDGVPATAEVLPQIARAVGGSVKVLVDGGIRSGLDVFRALALGADGVLVARPFVTAVYGGGAEGVKLVASKLQAELADAMRMCGAASIADIDAGMIWREG